MKELTKEFQDNEIAIVQEAEQKKNLELLRKERKVRGHILWQFNTKTRELTPAKYKAVKIEILGNSYNEKFEVVVNENCIYFQSLNRDNAKKTLKKKHSIVI